MVNLYPERGQVVEGADIEPARIRQFIADNLALLIDPRNNVGTWFNDAEGRTYLDVSTALPNREQVLALGQRYNQMFVFDLDQLVALDTGGTGEPPADLPPLAERIPALVGAGAPGR
ncbi:MAG TPA: hypothetical protein VM536_16020 [Chloroflexia bacterium]|nr:hypothetical protein [Chloroflexia bacterium]